MIIQLTNYGVSQLTSTQSPLKITRYVLGDAAGYVPDLDQTGIKGAELYSSGVVGPEVVSANVSKYRIGLDYGIGDFQIGEVALYDNSDQCVAIGVESTPIAKTKNTTATKGNTLVLDTYLSMVGENYAMWIDKLSSSNTYNVPIIESVDQLEPVANATPNFYIVKAPSREQSTLLAYTSQTGLWEFNEYDYINQIDINIASATATSIKFDISDWSDEDKENLILNFFGEIIVEFTSGQVYSICRYARNITVAGKTCTITFMTPMAIIPEANDKCKLFYRHPVSTTNAVLPVASRDSIGAVSVGAGLDITPMGSLSANVQSVNGQIGEVVIKIDDEMLGASAVAKTGSYNDLLDKPLLASRVGLINPIEITSGDLNTYVQAGLFFGKKEVVSTIANMPTQRAEDWTLEVIPEYAEAETENFSCVQRFHSKTFLAFRAFSLAESNWSPWVEVFSSSNTPVASDTVLGMIRVGAGLVATEGTLEAKVKSVFGKTGDVDMTQNELFAKLAPFNTKGTLPRLTETDGVTGDDASEMDGARLPLRQLTFGALYNCGTWDPTTGYVNGDPLQSLKDNGLVTYNVGSVSQPSYKTWNPKGWILKVTQSGSHALDGIADWVSGDLIINNGSKWELFIRNTNTIISSIEPGIVVKDQAGSLKSTKLVAKTSLDGKGGLEITNPSGYESAEITIGLKATGVAAGTYFNLTVNELGQVTDVNEVIDCGLY